MAASLVGASSGRMTVLLVDEKQRDSGDSSIRMKVLTE